VVNLAAGQGHPPETMDMSFALQALAVEHLVRAAGSLAARVHPVPADVDTEVARLKLVALGVRLDAMTADQRRYRTSWG
jgi:adenosylhomocysteinase